MTLKQFKPHDATGPNEQDMLFRSYVTGPQGSRFELLQELHHTNEDIKRAKQYLKTNFDVVSIDLIKETTQNTKNETI
jgi:hypothetical protein